MRFNNINKFIKLSFKTKLLYISVFIISGIMRMLILAAPFKKIVSLMSMESTDSQKELSEIDTSKALKVGEAVFKVCNHTPWQSKCYVRALTAQFLLRLHRIPSTIYLGVALDESKKLKAHAWLRCGSHILVGENEMNSFKCISFYSTKFKSSH